MERIEDLQLNDLRIVQETEKFQYGTDGVLLGRFAKPKPGNNVLDIGTGTGIVTFMMFGLMPDAHYTGIDLQQDMIALAKQSQQLNGIKHMEFVTVDLKHYDSKRAYEVIVCNPPYEKVGTGSQNPAENLSRYEIAADFGDIAACVSRNIRPNGRFYTIHKAERLPEISRVLHEYGLELKSICPVLKNLHSVPRLLLLEAREGGKEYLHWQKPVVLYDEQGRQKEYGELL